MEHRHLWVRTPRQSAVLRIRAEIIKAARDYLDDHGFVRPSAQDIAEVCAQIRALRDASGVTSEEGYDMAIWAEVAKAPADVAELAGPNQAAFQEIAAVASLHPAVNEISSGSLSRFAAGTRTNSAMPPSW